MKKLVFYLLLILICENNFSQPIPEHYYNVWQKDSLYYILSDKAISKHYSHEESGKFFLTDYFEKKFTGNVPSAILDNYFLFSSNDSIFVLSNTDPFDFELINVFVPGYDVRSLHSFGPYFCIRRIGEVYSLYKITNDQVITVEDTLFVNPSQSTVFFSFPFFTRGNIVYKYLEGFGSYAVTQLAMGVQNTNIIDSTLIKYIYWEEEELFQVHSILYKAILVEPNFPIYVNDGWGFNIIQLQHSFGTGTFVAKKNLYYMMWCPVITTANSQLAFVPTTNDHPVITDYYIFNIKNSLLYYSKWNAGSVFYPFTATNLTSIGKDEKVTGSYILNNNYPNPFNPYTIISWNSPIPTWQTLKIYDILGNEITTLVDEYRTSGYYEIRYDATNISNGVYFYRLTLGDVTLTKKMVVVK